MNPAEIVSILRARDIDAPSGGYIEELNDAGLARPHHELVERFLASDDIDNRESALRSLVLVAGRVGYSFEALLLFASAERQIYPSEAETSAVGCLSHMASNGDGLAYAALRILSANPRWLQDFGNTAIRYLTRSLVVPERPEDWPISPTRSQFLSVLEQCCRRGRTG